MRLPPEVRNPNTVFFTFAFITAFLLYGVALEAPFYLDDQLVTETAAGTGGNRPLVFFTFRLSRAAIDLLFPFFHWKMQLYYRAPNVLIHALAATAVFWLAREILKSQGRAALAGILFLVHPIQTQAITYVSQRFESMAALFMFCSAAAYVRYRHSGKLGWAGICFLAGIGAVLSKETAVALPLWLLAIELVFISRGRLPRPSWYWLPPVVVLAVFLNRSAAAIGKTFSWVSWNEYWMSQGPVITTYLRLLVFPAHQYLIYDFMPVTSFSVALALQWLLVLSVVAAGLWLLRSHAAVGWGILSFFILLLPVMVLPIPDLIFEHRVYPAFAGIAIAVAAALPLQRRWVTQCAIVLLLALSARTVVRNAEWNDSLTFYEAHARAFPKEPRVLTFLAGMHFSRGEVNRSLEEMLVARANEERVNLYYLSSTRTSVAMNLAIAYNEKGNLEAAKREALKAVTLSPKEAGALRVLGQVQLDLNEISEAQATFRKLTELKPEMIDGWVGLNQASLLLGDAVTADKARESGTAETAKLQQEADRHPQIPTRYRTTVTFAFVFLALAGLLFALTFVYRRLRVS